MFFNNKTILSYDTIMPAALPSAASNLGPMGCAAQ